MIKPVSWDTSGVGHDLGVDFGELAEEVFGVGGSEAVLGIFEVGQDALDHAPLEPLAVVLAAVVVGLVRNLDRGDERRIHWLRQHRLLEDRGQAKLTLVVDQPARTREVAVPAQYKTVKKTVLAEPAKTREIKVPAEYGTVEVTKLVTPPQERKVEIPAEYGNVTKRVRVTDDKLEWRQVLCDVNMTPANVRTLQTSLRDKGYEAGPIDGILGAQTLGAASAYAKKNGLPYGSNYIPIQVADKLGLKY